MSTVKQERSNWRDQELSERHRKWGFHCPAADCDFILMEYDLGQPVALIEYKNEHYPWHKVNLYDKTFWALRRLADRAHVLAFVVRYGDDQKWFEVHALNLMALPEVPVGRLDELQYVTWLYGLRCDAKFPNGLPMPDSVRQEIAGRLG